MTSPAPKIQAIISQQPQGSSSRPRGHRGEIPTIRQNYIPSNTPTSIPRARLYESQNRDICDFGFNIQYCERTILYYFINRKTCRHLGCMVHILATTRNGWFTTMHTKIPRQSPPNISCLLIEKITNI